MVKCSHVNELSPLTRTGSLPGSFRIQKTMCDTEDEVGRSSFEKIFWHEEEKLCQAAFTYQSWRQDCHIDPKATQKSHLF